MKHNNVRSIGHQAGIHHTGRARWPTLALALTLALGLARADPRSAAARQQLEALRVWQLTPELNLTEDQSAQFVPKLKLMRELKQTYREQRNAVLKDLGAALRDSVAGRATLRSLIDSLDALEDGNRASELRLRNELRGILTIEQQARFHVFQANFDRQTRQMIQNLRGRNRRRIENR